MPRLDDELVRWAVGVAAPGAEVDEVRGLRAGGSPWLIRLSRGSAGRGVVLRVGQPDRVGYLRTEAAALRLAVQHGIPVPRLLGVDFERDPPVVLTEAVAGRSTIPAERPEARLRALGGFAAMLHQIPLGPGPDLPYRDRPIAVEDFAAMRREAGTDGLLKQAEERVAERPVPGGAVFVHGDLWQGNALWSGDSLSAVVDWDCAGAGPAGVDLGSLRCDAAFCFGLKAADDVLHGWEECAGRPAEDVAYWDVVAALSTPPDMAWFPEAIGGQGRPDLTREVLLERREEFLRAALKRWN